ncbi:bifunctional 3-(3-hydroxy-phenyl)propionate/3-hydroxycinnamic acid hydroxylase [Streptomyces hygroscopicus]|uniref:bifunctional 3-(3-hydroxy-phenyl)propionate/3-hydroxycinnamic acid hydroxylase n=1 Tax=Streptomyces hygroscopicus TaxID=1912 RepID=UPI0033D234DD
MSEATHTEGETDVDVAVLGCGTTGLVLARLLAMQGLRVGVVDSQRIPRSFPRATHLDDETMRTFQTLGLGHLEERFSPAGVYRFYDPQWRPVMEFAFNKGVTDQGWQSDYMFHQPDFEAVLRGHAHADLGTSHFFGWEATELTASDRSAHLRIRERGTGREHAITAAFLVGSDGAHSFVRRTMGGAQVNYDATHRSLIVDILPFVRKENLSHRDSFIQAGIRNPLTFVAMAEPLLRFEQLLRPDDDTADFESPEHVYELLSPFLGPDEYRVLRADVYQWQAVVAESWRKGPLFLAGDAAHEMPPHLGQGMVSGIRDALNIAWKLGRVVRGESPPELLDTYDTERKPHMTEYVKLAAQLANEVEEMEPQGAEAGRQVPVTERQALRPRLGPGIRTEDDFGGWLSAQPALADGRRLDDVVGYRFAVLGTAECLAGLSARAKESLESLDAVSVTADSEEAERWLKTLGAGAVLIRPDRYLYGAAASAQQLDALVNRLQTALVEGTW